MCPKSKHMTNVFKEMNETIFKGVKGITWYDKEGIMNLDETRYVRLILDDLSCRDRYDGYWVEVYNRNNGVISKKFFMFEYHMEFTHRIDLTNNYHIWYYEDKLDWYISRPKDTKKYVKILMGYIEEIK